MPLQTATAAQLEAVLDDTYPVWGEGLTRRAYGQWNHAQMATAWGRRHLRRVVLLDRSGLVLASAKRYDFTARLRGARVPVLGIGAVFTPPGLRGRGHARALLDAMHDDARARGCAMALLFSEIGPEYYAALGYRAIDTPAQIVDVPRGRAGAPATLVRAGDARDLPEVAAIAAERQRDHAFALERSADLFEFSIARRRLLAGLGPAGRRRVEFFVAEEGMRPVAYVVLTHGPRGAILEDCGDRDPAGARVGAMLQVLAAREPAERGLPLASWLPPSIRPPQLRVEPSDAVTEVMMVRPLREDSALGDFTDTDYPMLDVF